MNILIIEDNATILKGLVYLFETNDYNVKSVTNVKETVEYLSNFTPDIIILDIMLPDGNGFNLFNNHIKEKNIPTIFLTAKDDEDDIVKGLRIGADDYITKPFSAKELLARVSKIVGRIKKQNTITVKDIKFEIDSMRVYKNGNLIELSSLELRILYILFLNVNRVVSRNTLLDTIWESTGNDVDDHTITVYLKRIREKIGDGIIKTIKGIGYIVDEK